MNQNLKEALLTESDRIGKELLQKAKRDKYGVYWETHSNDGNYKMSWKVGEDLYSGVSGILLFLMELHKRTGDEKYYQTVKESIPWLVNYCNTTESDHYAFFTGRMGVSYTLLKAAAFLDDNSYIEEALRLAKKCEVFIQRDKYKLVDDMINGMGGALLGLLHLHSATGEKWILTAIENYIKKLIERANNGIEGLYWDRSHLQVRGLSGFSHGAAGMGAVFLELGKYFGNRVFYEIAEQAFLYETHSFDQETGTWPDFRVDHEKSEKAYREKNIKFFTAGYDVNAWCHGAAGVGLSRLRAYELLKNEDYKLHAVSAIAKTVKTDVEIEGSTDRSYTLCHGSGGNSSVFIEAYLLLKDKKYLAYAEKVAERAMVSRRNGNLYLSGWAFAGEEDTSLFLGNAGIGYFYLRTIFPENVPCIEYPKLQEICVGKASMEEFPFINLSSATLKKFVLQKRFKRTILAIEGMDVPLLNNYFNSSRETLDIEKKKFTSVVQSFSSKMKEEDRIFIDDVLALEEISVKMDENIKSTALLYAKQMVLSKDITAVFAKNEEDFMDTAFVADPENVIVQVNWDWTALNESRDILSFKSQKEEMSLLLIPTYHGITEFRITPLIEAILSIFSQGKKLKQALDEGVALFDEPANAAEEQMIKGQIFIQIKELIRQRMLILSV